MADASGLINPSPVVFERKARPPRHAKTLDLDSDDREKAVGDASLRLASPIGVDEAAVEEIDSAEIFDHIRDIADPEHPYSLEQLNVVGEENIECSDKDSSVTVKFTPTVPHCSMATLIGLSIRVKLLRSLPSRFKVDIFVSPGSHASEDAVNKQLNDKERVAAAMENPHLQDMVEKCLEGSYELA